VNQLSSSVVYQQSLCDAIYRSPLRTISPATDDRAATGLRRRRAHRVVGVRPREDLRQPIQVRRQFIKPIDRPHIESPSLGVNRQMADVERETVEHTTAEFFEGWNGSPDREQQAG